MTELALDKVLDLTKKGYKVSFEQAPEYPSFCKVLRIEVSKGDKHSVELMDISKVTRDVTQMTTDQLISRHLRKVEWEFMYAFEKEENNEI